jgi:hypothetical protein
MRLEHARQIDWYDGKFIRGFADTDVGFRIWSVGGRCEFTARRLIRPTDDDQRKGPDLFRPQEFEFFTRKWAWRYGQGFDLSETHPINVHFDPVAHPEFVDGFSVYRNSPAQVAEIEKHSPPCLVRSENGINVVWYQGRFHCIPQELGPVDLEKGGHENIVSYPKMPEHLPVVEPPPSSVSPGAPGTG